MLEKKNFLKRLLRFGTVFFVAHLAVFCTSSAADEETALLGLLNGDSSTNRAIGLKNLSIPGTGTVVETNISAAATGGTGNSMGVDPSITIDSTNDKILMATTDNNIYKPALFRCDLDATNCTHTDLDQGYTTKTPNIIVSGTKLITAVATNAYTYLRLIRCNLDGTSCASLSPPQGVTLMGNNPLQLLDGSNLRVLTTLTTYGYSRPYLWNCASDGANCSSVQLSTAGFYRLTGILDQTNNKLLVVSDYQGGRYPYLMRCNKDGTSCGTPIDISSSLKVTGTLSMAIDADNSKLLVLGAKGANPDYASPVLYRCDLDGTNCTATELDSGNGSYRGYDPSLVIDDVNDKLLFSATEKTGGFGSEKIVMYKCDLDGTNCTRSALSSGFGIVSKSVIDTVNGKFLTAFQGYYGRLYMTIK